MGYHPEHSSKDRTKTVRLATSQAPSRREGAPPDLSDPPAHERGGLAASNAHDTVERMKVRMRLLEAGITPTIQRLEIGRAVLRGPRHVSADDLYHELEDSSFQISRATIYNTLKLFVQKGLLREIIVSAERVFYDSTTGHHHHFYDVETGELIDIPAEAIAVTRYPAPPPDMKTEEVDVLIKVRRTA